MISVLLYAQDGTASRDTVYFESIPPNHDRQVQVDEVLGAGFTFSTSITLPSWKGINATLYWQQHTRESPPNPLATALLQRASSVRGDALLIITPTCTYTPLSSIVTKLQALAAGQGLQTMILRQQHHHHHHHHHQKEVGYRQAATPPHPPPHPTPHHHLNNKNKTHHHHQPPKQQHRHAAAGGNFGHDPRQKLLWSIAGQATSLTWEQPRPRPSSSSYKKKEEEEREEEEREEEEVVMDGGNDDGGAEEKKKKDDDVRCPPKRRHCISSLATNDDTTTTSNNSSNNSSNSVPCQVEQQQPPPPDIPSTVWTHISPEVLGCIIAQQGYSSAFTRTISQVCKSWRMAVGRDKKALSLLQFRSRLQQIVSSPSYTTATGTTNTGNKNTAATSLPWLVMEASKAGNTAATLCLARYLSSSSSSSSSSTGRREDSFKYWARAAALGVGEGQFEMGRAHYRGVWGVPRDPEDALMWLSRFMKPYEEKEKDDGGGGGGNNIVLGVTGEVSSIPTPDPSSSSSTTTSTFLDVCDTKRVTEASLMLGYLHLDGECGKSDIGRALKWLRIAAQLGCQEAARVIGSMLNTGQF